MIFVCCMLATGCWHFHNVSHEAPYPKFVGKDDSLVEDCELWKDGTAFPTYRILSPVGVSDREYAKLAKGTIVRVEEVARKSGFLLMPFGMPHSTDYALVSLADPKSPNRRIKAEVGLAYLELLGVHSRTFQEEKSKLDVAK